MDILIDKPPRIRGYALHRIVEQYRQGKPALWADEGPQLRIRPEEATPPIYDVDKLLAFTTTACVSFSSGHKHKYLPLEDWRGRRAWLDKQGHKHGFEIVGVHIRPAMQEVHTHDGRRFKLDATEFTGLLKVVEPQTFAMCLIKGIGKVGKAFGLNLLIVQ
jgi:hypothetical protein